MSREIRRNRGPGLRAYRALAAHAQQRARRRRPRTLTAGSPLREQVVRLLRAEDSPQQIAATLKRTYPDQPGMWVRHETIYQALFVQARAVCVRRLLPRSAVGGPAAGARTGNHTGRSPIPGMVSISQRPAEAADRAVPGHWEGDLVIGRHGKRQIATLAERTSRLC